MVDARSARERRLTLARRALWPVILVAGLAAESVLLQQRRDPPPYIVYDLAIGFTTVYVSLAVWEARPSNRVGPLLFLYSAWFLLSPVRLIPNPAWISLGWVLQLLTAAWFAHFVLAYPSGRLPGRRERGFVVFAYAFTIAMPVAELLVAPASELFGCPPSGCPSTPPLLHADMALFSRLQSISDVVLAAMVLVFLALVALRFVDATPRRVRQLWPVAVVATASAINFAIQLFAPAAGSGPWDISDITDHVVHLGIAVALLAGFYSSRLERSRIADLLAQLAGSRADAIQPLLARVLRDPGLRLGIWEANRGGYRDQGGLTLASASAGTERATTPVTDEQGGSLAMLIHDPAVLDDPRLVASVVAATRLALENDQLHRRVEEQLAEVRASRARLIQAGDEERRRLERDLHDGAQQRLLAIGMALQLAQASAGADAAQIQLLREAQVELEAALSELRQLGRGIHPAVLTDRGLAGGVRALAQRCPVPVDLLAVPEKRLPDQVEKATYFIVSEALQNVARHAHASHAFIKITQRNGHILVDVSDDGIGGADVDRGSGLRGLRDRVEAVDGTLAITSPAGRGTRVYARLPCES